MNKARYDLRSYWVVCLALEKTKKPNPSLTKGTLKSRDHVNAASDTAVVVVNSQSSNTETILEQPK
jgi:hypothetical protein